MISKNKKKIAALAVVVGLAATAFFAVQTIGASGSPHSYTVLGNPSYVNSTGVRYVNDSTNISIYGVAGNTAGSWTIHYRIMPGGSWTDKSGVVNEELFKSKSEGKYYLEYYATDENGGNESGTNWEGLHNETYVVDKNAPTSSIDFGNPSDSGGGNTYITSDTPINLSASDNPTTPNSGVKYIEFKIVDGSILVTWTKYTGNFTFGELGLTDNGIYTIQYRAADNLDQVETVKSEPVIIDNTPPWHKTILGNPNITKDGKTYINYTTPITIKIADNTSEYNVSSVHLYWRVYNGSSWQHYDFSSHNWEAGWGSIHQTSTWSSSGVDPLERTIHLNTSECVNTLQYYVEDDLGNRWPSDYDMELVYHVDNSTPVTNLSYNGNSYYNSTQDIEYITPQTKIVLNSNDNPSGCAVENVTIKYSLKDLVTGAGAGAGEWHTYTKPLNLSEGRYNLRYYATDGLGQKESTHWIQYRVDSSPPVTWKYHEGAVYNDTKTMTISATIDHDWNHPPITETNLVIPQIFQNYISISSDDVLWDDQTWSGTTTGLIGTITMHHHSAILTSGSNNGFGRGTFNWTDENGGYINGTYVADHTNYVNTLGKIYGVGDGKYAGEYITGTFKGTVDPDNEFIATVNFHNITYVTSSTNISINATDLCNLSSVGSYRISYRVDNGAWEKGTANQSVTFNLSSYGEGNHTLEWYATDDLKQNSMNLFQNYCVDDTPPDDNLSIGEPRYKIDDTTYKINSTTPIYINATDKYSGVKEIWRSWYGTPGTWYRAYYGIRIGIPSAGKYTLSINVTDNLGNNQTKNYTIYIDDKKPTAHYFIGSPHWPADEITTGNISTKTPIYMYGEDSGEGARWKVNYTITDNKTGELKYSGKGNWFEVLNLTFEKLSLPAGEYNLTYWAEDGVNTGVHKYKVLHVIERPLARIDYHPNPTYPVSDPNYKENLTTMDKISFFPSRSNSKDIVEWYWNFGDGHSATGENVTHKYDNPGTYTVKLTVKAFGGTLIESDTKTINITGMAPGPSNQYPVARFTIMPPQVATIYETVRFNSSMSYDPDGYSASNPGGITYRYWDFGDGTLSYNETAVGHNYPNPGTYIITLYVYDKNDCISATSHSLTVVDTHNPPSDFIYSPCCPKPGERVNFTGPDKTADTDGIIQNWTWNFGDNNVSYGQNVNHSYANPGHYEVTLVTKDNDGAIGTTTYQLRVLDVYTHTFNLVKGWNAISIPVQSFSTASDLLNYIYSHVTADLIQISRWNATASEFGGYDTLQFSAAGGFHGTDFELEGGVGYWIYINTDATFEVSGYPICHVNVTLDTTGNSKWNFLGWFKEYDTNAKAFVENITADYNHSEVIMWDAQDQSYSKVFIPIYLENNFAITRGTAFFVWVPSGNYWDTCLSE